MIPPSAVFAFLGFCTQESVTTAVDAVDARDVLLPGLTGAVIYPAVSGPQPVEVAVLQIDMALLHPQVSERANLIARHWADRKFPGLKEFHASEFWTHWAGVVRQTREDADLILVQAKLECYQAPRRLINLWLYSVGMRNTLSKNAIDISEDTRMRNRFYGGS